jgi:hypothetical protein
MWAEPEHKPQTIALRVTSKRASCCPSDEIFLEGITLTEAPLSPRGCFPTESSFFVYDVARLCSLVLVPLACAHGTHHITVRVIKAPPFRKGKRYPPGCNSSITLKSFPKLRVRFEPESAKSLSFFRDPFSNSNSAVYAKFRP